MKELLVQAYLRGGGTLESLLAEHAVHGKMHRGKASFLYDQFRAKRDDPLANQCRGLILREESWDVVAYPFERFFNHGEPGAAAIEWDSAEYQQKLDGTLIIVYWDERDRRWHAATRSMSEAQGRIGETERTFASLTDLAVRELGVGAGCLHDLMEGVSAPPAWTYMFELTGPENRVVCQYDRPFLTLLGARSVEHGAEIDPAAVASAYGFPVVKTWPVWSLLALGEMMRGWSPAAEEGVVVRDGLYRRVKLKTPQYLRVHHAIDSLGASWRPVCETILAGGAGDIYAHVPAGIRARLDSLTDGLGRLTAAIEHDYQELLLIEDMKAFAARAKERPWPAALFALKRGQAATAGEFLAGVQVDSVLALCRLAGWKETE